MTTITIRDRVVIELPEMPEDPTNKDSGHQHWVKPGRIKQCSYEWLAIDEMLDIVGSADCVHEAFGGLGIISSHINQRLKPKIHTACEIDPFCISVMEKLPFLTTVTEDSISATPRIIVENKPDFVSLDWNAMSMYRMLKGGDPNGAILRAAFENGTKFIHITDSARSKVHLHTKTYSEAFGYPIKNNDDYVAYLNKWASETYGYKVAYVAHENMANFTLFTNVESVPQYSRVIALKEYLKKEDVKIRF